MDNPSVAFLVEGELEPLQAPSTAEEYLQQVRWEANRIEDIAIAVDQKETVPQQFRKAILHRAPVIPVEMKPSSEWEEDILTHFEEARENWQTVSSSTHPVTGLQPPPIRNRKAWRQFCFGTNASPPLLSILATLDFVSLNAVGMLPRAFVGIATHQFIFLAFGVPY